MEAIVSTFLSQKISLAACWLVISFVSKGFPYEDQIEESFIVMVLLYVFPTRNIVNFLINFTFLFATYLSKHDIAYLCWKWKCH